MKILLAFLLPCLLAGGHSTLALRFNKILAHAIYERWDASTNGTLLFEFKTQKENGFLIYEDDPGGMDFIDIFLVNGRLRMRLHIGQCSLQQEFIHGNFSDNRWHRVRVFRAFESTHFKVDHHSSKIIKCGAKHSSFTARSSLYVGGFPLDISLNSLAFPGSFYEIYNGNRFVGCISGVKYSDAYGHFKSAVLKNTSGTTADCKRACTRPHEFIMKCKHGERCGDKMNDCDCLETGYEGQDCTQASTSVWLNGTGYIEYNLVKDTKDRSTLRNYIGFRFRTSMSDGVILHTSVKGQFLVIELLAGNIVLKLDLGKDRGELVLTAGIGRLSDNRWHWVEVKRRSRHVTMILDGRVTKKGRTPGPASSSKLVLKGGKEVIYFGGGPSRHDLGKSYSQRNFSGFLQQLRFDEYKILDKVINEKKDERFTKHGLVIDAKLLVTVATPIVTVRPTTHMAMGSGDCAGSDDEDCVTESVISQKNNATSSFSMPSDISTQPSLIYADQQASSIHHGVPAWIITITVVAAVISILITVFIVYRWNTRYSGSFSTASAIPKSDMPQQWPEPPLRTVPVVTSPVAAPEEHPTIYVTSYDKV